MGRHVPTHVRTRILRRDGHTCQMCGSQGVPLEIDHRNNTRGPGYDSDENLWALCGPCHEPKSKKEAVAGARRRRALGYYPRERHPGLI